MKRYEMTAEYNSVGCYDEVIPVESADGDWIKFSDYQAATEAAKATGTACATCNDNGIVGRAPDDYYPCPDCATEAARQPAPVAAQENGGLVRAALIDLMEIEQAATAGEFKQDMTFDFAKQSHYRALFARARAALAATAEPIAAYGLPPFPANGYGTLSSDGIFHAGYIAAISNLPNGLIECMREAAQVLSGQKENRVPLADELDGFASILAATRSQP